MADEPVLAPRVTMHYYLSSQDDPRLRAVVARNAYGTGFLPNMLREDCLDVLPRPWRGGSDFKPVVLSDDPSRASTLIASALALDPGERVLAEALRAFFTATADTLLRFPSAYYEVVYAYTPTRSESGVATGFRLLPIPPGTVDSRRGRPVQYVPVSAAARRTRRGVGFVILDPAALAAFRLDAGLEHRVKTAAAALADADSLPGTATREAAAGRARRRRPTQSVTTATAPVGWNGRVDVLSKEQLTPYQVWRRLECLAFKIKVRQAILVCLNSALTEASRRLQLPMSIELEGVATLDDVRGAQDDLRHGRQSLDALTLWALQ